MKKAINIIVCFLVSLIILTTYVRAEDEACKISVSADKTTLKPGDEVTITLLMSNVNKTSGISQLLSILEYSNNIFEIVPVIDSELKSNLADTEFKDCQILYSGEKDTDTTIKNPWYILYIENSGAKGIYGATTADPQIETQVIGKIKLKVKENIQSTKTTVGIVDTEVFDAETISNTTSTENLTGYKISDSKIELQINGITNTGTTNNTSTTGNQSNAQNTQTQTENKAKKDVPYTGIENFIPFIIIMIAIAGISYMRYKKYKDI